jgi:restriction system protein
MAVPSYDRLYNPLLQAMRELGGSGSVDEIEDKVGQILQLSEKDLNQIHKKNTTKLGYRLAWARNYLKRYGLLENSARGVWALTAQGTKITTVNKDEVNKKVKQLEREAKSIEFAVSEGEGPEKVEKLWEDQMLQQLLGVTPEGFERLCQRVLRESGFVQVEVTGKTGDGGIDGKGLMKIGGLLSFRVIFQCKRYNGSVSSKQIRDFRGAMIGRADRGLFMTTGTFTRDAKQEATRDGAPAIDLIEGSDLIQKMKELHLGVRIKTEEVVEVDKDWFKNF